MQESKKETPMPGISFSKKRGEIMVFRSTIQALSEPVYIRFLMNMEKGCLAVQACERKTVDCFKVPTYDPKDWTFRIYSEVDVNRKDLATFVDFASGLMRDDLMEKNEA
ncbi:MAG: hypothetical protein LUH14_08205, partial [Clostridiaceae bacterium]|nr:hypothetical protein [Clostridiaceae bacterium]